MSSNSSIKRLPLIALCLFLWAAWAEASNYTGIYKRGAVDWSNGVIEAKGIGFPPGTAANSAQARSLAKGSAIEDARKSLLSVIEQLPLTSEQSVKDYIEMNGSLRKDLTSLCLNAHLCDIAYGDNGLVAVTLSLRLYGTLSEKILPQNIKVIPSIAQEPRNQKKNGAYTGIILDCRGLRKSPVLVPKVVDEDGVEVYGPAYASRESAVSFGMAVWLKDISFARANSRAGDKPLVVKAIGSAEKSRAGNIRISNADAEKISGQAANLDLMHRCRVIFVLD